MSDAANAAGLRNTFNAKPGAISDAVGKLLRVAPVLSIMIPFRRTIGNIFKEGARMTPGLNFLVKEWRDDFAAGGARRDMALAEVTVGTAVMGGALAMAAQGSLTGGGSPEPGQRDTDRAAGWKPYAVKINGTYYDGYQRMSPWGQLVGMAADFHEVSQYLAQEEHDRLAQMIGFSFAQNITNQTFMQGVTDVINAAQDPGRYGAKYIQNLAGSVVPGLIAGVAREGDPLMREVNSALDAIKARIPGIREGLFPKIDIFGEPIKTTPKSWYGSPFSVSAATDDKVRSEAMRVGFAVRAAPKNEVETIAGLRTKNELTPAQKDVFNREQGTMAYDILKPMVNSPGWDEIPDVLKRQTYENVYAQARNWGMRQAITPENLVEDKQRAIERFQRELDVRRTR